MEVKIDKGVPLPNSGRAGKFPWHDMQPGDSFFAAGYVSASRLAKNGDPAMSVKGGRDAIPGSKWIVRTVTENGVKGVRVWRVA